ncbi:MAG: NAD(P)/FAD-dependent oxidoreductase [Sellimonas sp.]|uniref:NAD(P)/FAD-dependent oxidoreductase n=1 Tax=Sellimonas sp. TaxID=2021466 RepID=UPI0039A04883
MKRILIIGGGASGMMAAIFAKRSGVDVVILEHGNKLGKKILATGNGRCNFTNIEQRPDCYRGDEPTFGWNGIRQFSAQDTIRFFLELGIYSKNRNGYLYPHSDQASAILSVLLAELDRLGVQVETNIEVKEIFPGKPFRVRAVRHLFSEERKSKKRTILVKTGEEAVSFKGDAVILACGGMAAPSTGSDGSGLALAETLGHSIVSCTPALVQICCRESWFRELSGVRASAGIRLLVDGEIQAADTGEVQFTDYGLSGIPAFQVSRYASKAFGRKENEMPEVRAEIDFLPEFTMEQAAAFLKNRIRLLEDRPMDQFFVGLFHEKIGQLLVRLASLGGEKKAGDLEEDEIQRIIKLTKCLSAVVTGTNGFEQAQVCAGGVSTKEIDGETMESRIVPGLYFAGEIMDVDGICGGYNLQWAWSSGQIAGRHAAIEDGKENI